MAPRRVVPAAAQYDLEARPPKPRECTPMPPMRDCEPIAHLEPREMLVAVRSARSALRDRIEQRNAARRVLAAGVGGTSLKPPSADGHRHRRHLKGTYMNVSLRMIDTAYRNWGRQ
jgi:hypothetical protein